MSGKHRAVPNTPVKSKCSRANQNWKSIPIETDTRKTKAEGDVTVIYSAFSNSALVENSGLKLKPNNK